MFSIASEQLHDFLHAELSGLGFTALDSLICELPLLLLEFEDTFLDAVLDRNFVNNHICFLCEAMDSVNGLLLNKLFVMLVSILSERR